ncbi:Protein O-mannosyltransferase 2 [Coemansia sp. RSA 2322]|nr:Protein O-mannosyltransferase 2 [Coemansia sp. RSA 2322]
MSGHPKRASILHEQGGPGPRFDDIHLPPRPMGFSAYPLAEKDSGEVSPTAFMTSRGSRRSRWHLADDRTLLAVLTMISLVTHMYRIGRRSSVTWDESHFGSFSGKYMNRTFYHDVHPPLAKMLVALSDVLAGHNGTFNTKTTHIYPDYYNYRFMRVFNACFGVALTPMAFLTCRQLRMPAHFATMAALFVTFDNALCVMSRFILLDAPLLAFTALVLTMLAYFCRQRAQPFSYEWRKYLLLTGLSLGLVASSKWVGLFAVALVGIFTIQELYEMFCNVRMPVKVYAKHWAWRILALVVIPFTVYAFCFVLHFAVLNRYDSSANFMPMGFQVKLRGNPLSRQPYDIQTGSKVRLYSRESGTGYLHSHTHTYPSGSQRQQITGYGFADQNNFWNIERREVAGSFKDVDDVSAHSAPIDGPIGHGDLIALHHNSTDSYLYTELSFKAPVSLGLSEVCAVNASKSEARYPNSLWVVEIVDPEKRMNDGRIHPLGTPVRLRSIATGCILVATGERLDKDWGWGQAEIACDADDENSRRDSKYLWTIERHSNKDLPAVDLGKYMSTSFLKNFAVLNRQMWLTNNALIPDHDKHNVLESDPISWPFMVYPMRMVGWDDTGIKYLEIGNPFLWWASAIVCLVFPLQLLYWLVCWQRKCLTSWQTGEFREYIDGALMLWGGWALHYMPFFLMGRVTYLHHYLPALYFAILFLAYQICHTSAWYLAERNQRRVLFAASALVLFGFWWFSSLTYGWDKPIASLRGMQWASSWPVYEDVFDV